MVQNHFALKTHNKIILTTLKPGAVHTSPRLLQSFRVCSGTMYVVGGQIKCFNVM